MARNSIKVYKTQMKVKVTKAFQKEIAATNIDLMRIVDNKLYYTYKKQLTDSYEPLSNRGKSIKAYNEDPYTTHRKKVSYHYTGILARSVDTIIEGNTTRIHINDDEVYDDGDGKKPSEVIEMLDKGTKSGGYYSYVKKEKYNNGSDNYSTGLAYNYGRPARLITEHTRNEMNEFCDEVAEFMRSNIAIGKLHGKKVIKYGPVEFRRILKRKYGTLTRKRYK